MRRLGSSGEAEDPNGGRVSRRAIYIGIAVIVAGFCTVNALSTDDDLTRLGRAHQVWEPFAWEASSAALLIALLTLPRHAARLAKTVAHRPVTACLSLLALVVLFSAAHIVGMVALRHVVYAFRGLTYAFDWSGGKLLYEFRKDLFSFSTLTILFWLAERAFERNVAPVAAAGERGEDAAVQPLPPRGSEIWLRDGRSSILVDARDIVWVGSAGNYVEYAMADGPRHLIRGTLQQEEARLSDFGIARVHRTRLINLHRVVAINWRKSGDFELSFDTGETVAGSRRHKNSIAGIGE